MTNNQMEGEERRTDDAGQSGAPRSQRPRITITKDDVRSVPESALRAPSRLVRVTPVDGLRTSGKAVAALAFGLAGIPLMGILIGPFAIIFGGWALYEIGRTNHLAGKNLARSGIILGVFDIILWAFIFIILFMRSFTRT